MTINLSEEDSRERMARLRVQEPVAAKVWDNTEDAVYDLQLEALRQEIQKGIDSGPPEPVTSADWESHRQRLGDSLAAPKGAPAPPLWPGRVINGITRRELYAADDGAGHTPED